MLGSVPFRIFTATSDNPEDNGVTCGFAFDVTKLRNKEEGYISQLENQLTNELKGFFLPGSKFRLIKRKNENVYDVLLIDDHKKMFWPVVGEAKEEKQEGKYFFKGDFFKKISEFHNQDNEKSNLINEDNKKAKNLIYLKQLSAIQENAIFYNLPDVSKEPKLNSNVVQNNKITIPNMKVGENNTASYFCKQLDAFVKDNTFVSLLLSEEVKKKVGTQDRPFGLPSLFDADIFGTDAVVMHEALNLLKDKNNTIESLAKSVDDVYKNIDALKALKKKPGKGSEGNDDEMLLKQYAKAHRELRIAVTAFFLRNVQHYYNLHDKLRRLCVDFVNNKCGEPDFKEKVAKCLNVPEDNRPIITGILIEWRKGWDKTKLNTKTVFNKKAATLLNKLLNCLGKQKSDSLLHTFNKQLLPAAVEQLYNGFVNNYYLEDKSSKKSLNSYDRTNLQEELLKTDIYEYELKRMLYFGMYNIIVNAFDKTGKLKENYDLLKQLQGCFDKYGVHIDSNNQIYAKILLNNFLKNVFSGQQEEVFNGTELHAFFQSVKNFDNLNVIPLCIGNQVDILNIISDNLSTTIDAQAKKHELSIAKPEEKIIKKPSADPKKKIIKATIIKPEEKNPEVEKPEGSSDIKIIKISKKKKKSKLSNKSSEFTAPEPAPGGAPKTEDTFGGSTNKFVRVGDEGSNIFRLADTSKDFFNFDRITSLSNDECVLIAGNPSRVLDGGGMMDAAGRLVERTINGKGESMQLKESFEQGLQDSFKEEEKQFLLPAKVGAVNYTNNNDPSKTMQAVYCVGVGNVTDFMRKAKNDNEKKAVLLEFIKKQTLLADMLVDMLIKHNNNVTIEGKIQKLCINGIGNGEWAPEGEASDSTNRIKNSHIADDILGHVLRVRAKELKDAGISLFVAGPLANVMEKGPSNAISDELLKKYCADQDNAAKNLYLEVINSKTPDGIKTFLTKYSLKSEKLQAELRNVVFKPNSSSGSRLFNLPPDNLPPDNKKQDKKNGNSGGSALSNSGKKKKSIHDFIGETVNINDINLGEGGKENIGDINNSSGDNSNESNKNKGGKGGEISKNNNKGYNGPENMNEEDNTNNTDNTGNGIEGDGNRNVGDGKTFGNRSLDPLDKNSNLQHSLENKNINMFNSNFMPKGKMLNRRSKKGVVNSNTSNNQGNLTNGQSNSNNSLPSGRRRYGYAGNSLSRGSSLKNNTNGGFATPVNIAQSKQLVKAPSSSLTSISLKSGISTQFANQGWNGTSSNTNSTTGQQTGQSASASNGKQGSSNVGDVNTENSNNKQNASEENNNTAIAAGTGLLGTGGAVVEVLTLTNVISGVPVVAKVIIGIGSVGLIGLSIYFGTSSPDKPDNGVPKNNLNTGQPQVQK